MVRSICHKKGLKRIFYTIAAVMACIYLWLCLSMRLPARSTSFPEGTCMLYYIVNADGMKGLGHSILMLVDEEGCGTVLSFNGMQRSLGESLLGKSGQLGCNDTGGAVFGGKGSDVSYGFLNWLMKLGCSKTALLLP